MNSDDSKHTRAICSKWNGAHVPLFDLTREELNDFKNNADFCQCETIVLIMCEHNIYIGMAGKIHQISLADSRAELI